MFISDTPFKKAVFVENCDNTIIGIIVTLDIPVFLDIITGKA